MSKNSHADIVLIKPNDREKIYYGLQDSAVAVEPPYWLAMMGGYLHDAGIDVALIDAEAAGQTPEETADLIHYMNPKCIGVLTIGNNHNASTWKMPGVGILCRIIKKTVPTIPIFLWGNHPSSLPEKTLREEAVDYVIMGEGFTTIETLFHCCDTGKPQRNDILGLHYLENGRLCGNGHIRIIDNLDSLSVNGWNLISTNQRHYRNHMHFAFDDLSKRDQYGMILTALGCPFSCSYCSIKAFSGNSRHVRRRSLQSAIAEVDFFVKERNVYYLYILDECFAINREYALSFCKLLQERRYNLSIFAYCRIDCVDEELLTEMRKAGIRWTGYGIESSSNIIRKMVNKEQYSYEKTKSVIDLTHACDIAICNNVMFGLPGEKMEDMEADLQMMRELNCEYPNMYCTTALPGSQLYNEVSKTHPEWLPDTWGGYAQLSYDTKPLPTEYLTSEEILRFRDYAFQAFFADNLQYFDMMEKKFGKSAIDAINNMLVGKLKRKILGD
jgi:radical SAM superfamily enzyme YgiQ (UPF0313 family)